MKNIKFAVLSAVLFVAVSCHKNVDGPDAPVKTDINVISLSTDKASYLPGEKIVFTSDKALPSSAKVRFRHFSEIISENNISGTTWNWTAPSSDFTGYMADVYEVKDGKDVIYGSIAVDVSSDWTRFPRYGFLSAYPQMTDNAVKYYISELNRYHINGLQFYDWSYKHDLLLAGTAVSPATEWLDISNRPTYFSTVKGYIDAAHACNMKAMFYNLAYGVLSDAQSDGVLPQWYLFSNVSHLEQVVCTLPHPMFKSDIWLVDPSNTAWQQYIAARNRDVYTALGFDGYHIDQLGDWGTEYNYSGQIVNIPSAFESFIKAMKADRPEKRLVMNAVNQFGQQNMANSPVDFLYSEVWSPNDGYKDLANIIATNNSYSNNTKNSVLAAYMNYDLANSSGFFNTPGVLMTDAVIFAFGGAHLELGEHMLGKEYFPNSNLQMKGELRTSLFCYYDFMVAYENLLRDGGSVNSPVIACTNGKININQWPPLTGSVSVTGREFSDRQVIQLLNFSNATTLTWRDNQGTQAEPVTVTGIALNFVTSKTVKKMWVASPDNNYGTPVPVSFSQAASTVSFMLPDLKYWDMVVAEY